MRELEGSSECPICYDDTPHEHSGLEIGEYQSKKRKIYESQARNRQELQAKVAKKRLERIADIQAEVTRQTCDFCRDLNYAPGGDGTMYGLIYDTHTIRCPVCDRCFWSDES